MTEEEQRARVAEIVRDKVMEALQQAEAEGLVVLMDTPFSARLSDATGTEVVG